MDPLLIFVFIVAALIAIVPSATYAHHLWTERKAKRRAEKERLEKLEQELQEILSNDARARHEYYYPFPIGRTVDKEEFVRRYRQRVVVSQYNAEQALQRLKMANHIDSLRNEPAQHQSQHVVAASRVSMGQPNPPTRPTSEPDLLDVAIGVGIGMAVESILDDDNNRTSTSDSCRADDSFTTGGGDFGGGGASGSWDDDR